MQYQTLTSKNGATTVVIPMPGVKSVTVLALVNTGRRYEDSKVAGVSHFLEHMVFKGTKNYPTAELLAKTIDQVGGEFNAFTGKEYTGYYVKLASRFLDRAVDVITDMLCAPLLREDDIKRESGVIIEEINMYEDTPMYHIRDVFEDLMFQGSNLDGEIIGTKETVSNLKAQDFRDHLNHWYGWGNIVFVLAGDESVITPEVVQKKLEETFAKLDEARESKSIKPYLQAQYGKDRNKIVFKKTEQVHLTMGLPTFGRKDPRRHALLVLVTLLGKTMSSRLFLEIREKRGLCYSVRAGSEYFHEVGALTVHAGLDPKRIEEALAAIHEELFAATGKKPITAEEVEDAKQNIIGELALDLEDPHAVASWYGMKQLVLGEIETEEELVKRIEKVSLAEVQKLANEILIPSELRTAVIGPFHEADLKSVL